MAGTDHACGTPMRIREAEPEAALEAEPLLRPVWDEAPDDPPGPPHPAWDRRPDGAPARPRRAPEAAENLLAPLAAAQDALARLDARAETAPDPVRRGLIARLALREAAGWLAAHNAWVHPDDLALRTGNLAGRFDTAAQIARPEHALPARSPPPPAPGTTRRIFPRWRATSGWWSTPWRWPGCSPPCPAGTTRSPTSPPRPRGLGRSAPATSIRTASPPGARPSCPKPAAARTGRGAVPAPARPPLLAAADAALAWMESGIAEEPDALVALAIAALLLARGETLRTIPLPFWSAWPALGQPSEENLPRLRPAVARAICGMDRAPWPISFLAFAAEAARAGLRDLDRLQRRGRGGTGTGGRARQAVAAAGGRGPGARRPRGHAAGARGANWASRCRRRTGSSGGWWRVGWCGR